MKKETDTLDLFIETASISINDELTKKWKNYTRVSQLDDNLNVLPLQPYCVKIESYLNELRSNYDRDLNLNHYGDDALGSIHKKFCRLYNLKKNLNDELLNYMVLRTSHPKYNLIYFNISRRLKSVNEIYYLLKERIQEVEHFPTEYLNNIKEDTQHQNISKTQKINLRVSIYELAYICTVIKGMKLITDYVGKPFNKRFNSFIEQNFMCLDKDKKHFVPINDFKSTISKVTRDVNLSRNEKLAGKHDELLCEAYKVVGQYINQYSATKFIE
jgi:hypothetical protein